MWAMYMGLNQSVLDEELEEEAPKKTVIRRTFACKRCIVQWRGEGDKSNCFVCGRWGIRRQLYGGI